MRAIDRLGLILDVLAVPAFCVLLGGENAPLMILSLAVHELSHILALRLCKGRVIGFSSGGLGFRLRYASGNLSARARLAIVSAGAIANLVLAAVGLVLKCYRLVAVNIVLAAFNLLPIRGLDGGELLLCGLGTVLEPGISWRILHVISVATAAALWFFSLFVQLRLAPMPEILIVSAALLMRELLS